MRRVVITGLGLISPLASGVEKSWSRILNGDSGASLITRFDADRVATSTLAKFLSAMVQMELLMLMIGWNQKNEEK